MAPAAELARSLDIASLGPVTGPRLALLPGRPDRRPVVVVTGPGEADVTAALAQLGELAATATGHAARASTPYATRTAGRSPGARAWRSPISASMTWWSAGGPPSSPSISPCRTICWPPTTPRSPSTSTPPIRPASRPARRSAWRSTARRRAASPRQGRRRDLAPAPVFLPLRLLRPGSNRITLLAELPRADDRACAGPGGERLTLRASTRSPSPTSPGSPASRSLRPRRRRLPVPGGKRGPRPDLVRARPDRDTMAAAATLATRLGVAAGRPIPFAFAAGRSGVVGPTVMVAALRSLDAPLLTAAGLDPQALRDAWMRRDDGAPNPAPEASPIVRRQLLRRGGIPGCRATATAALGLPEAALVLAQGVTGPAPDDVLTLVTAPSPAALSEATACLVQPLVWSRPRGGVALLAPDGAVAVQGPGSPATSPPPRPRSATCAASPPAGSPSTARSTP